MNSNGALVDFDGMPIKVNRKGIFTPVDAVLEYKDGINVLTLSTDVAFACLDKVDAPTEFTRAVLDGLREWQGEYEVFGGQKLSVRVNLTCGKKIYDRILITPLIDEIKEFLTRGSKMVHSEKKKGILESIMNEADGSTIAGFRKWSVRSRKAIVLHPYNGTFGAYEDIKRVAKHEFGHVIGVGDLYADSSQYNFLSGVDRGTFSELDGYAIDNNFYNLVMCNGYGPISNNDIEMVILAFMENKQQLYQPQGKNKRISSALGRGN